MQASKTPGTVVTLLQSDASPEHLCFGVTSREGGQPITPQTVIQAASLGKPVFAYMVLKQCELRNLDLDAPLCDYLPEPLLVDERGYPRSQPAACSATPPVYPTGEKRVHP